MTVHVAPDDLADRVQAQVGQTAGIEQTMERRNAVARFDQVEGVTDAERDEAWARIQAAAKKFGVELQERSWRELGKPSR